ncbi:hypothetical protein [Sphingomonas sp.]|uniref:hypothetical protein n=1 Tax=Sphingomonas sp. TaxID=28214 RepID=UPI0025FDCA20|nr:hypothetical protein [Sphingomonas sp.]
MREEERHAVRDRGEGQRDKLVAELAIDIRHRATVCLGLGRRLFPPGIPREYGRPARRDVYPCGVATALGRAPGGVGDRQTADSR